MPFHCTLLRLSVLPLVWSHLRVCTVRYQRFIHASDRTHHCTYHLFVTAETEKAHTHGQEHVDVALALDKPSYCILAPFLSSRTQGLLLNVLETQPP